MRWRTRRSPLSSTRRCALPAPKAVLDTHALLRGQFVLLVSEPILAELDAVTARSDVVRKLRVTPREARAVLLRIRRRAVLARPEVMIRMSRDSTDDKFLECAVAGDCLVTADADLLSLLEVRVVPSGDSALSRTSPGIRP